MRLNFNRMLLNSDQLRLSEGWQAKLNTVRIDGGKYLIKKTYGKDLNWSKENIDDINNAMLLYTKWVNKHSIIVCPTLKRKITKHSNGYYYIIYQPYLGHNCESIIKDYYNKDYKDKIYYLLRIFINMAITVAKSQRVPVLRCEIKPKDYCIYGNKPILVDTFPPVLSYKNNGKRIHVARREENKECIISRERDEVLAVTGSAFGIIRNLCEHIVATVPKAVDIIKNEVIEYISIYDIGLSKEINSYFNSTRFTNKVNLLMSRMILSEYPDERHSFNSSW